MDERTLAVGRRIRAILPSGMTQAGLAKAADMTPDAMSRALNGQRGFSTLELTAIAHALDTDLHWLITGAPDPHALSVVARHNWDPITRTRSNPGRKADDAIIAEVQAVYHAAFPGGAPYSSPLPTDAISLREQLGEGFVRQFAETAEERLGVDVVRVAELSSDYSMSIGKRSVILLATNPWWFRSNWSLAHEIGHLALGHHDNDDASAHTKENAADSFAADLLLPEALLRQQNWDKMSLPQVADFLWSHGISGRALRTRLTFLRVTIDSDVESVLRDMSTPRLLSTYGKGLRARVADRKQRANARRMPLSLLAALTEHVEAGDADPQLLAWALDTPVDDLEFPEPSEVDLAEDYERTLASKPSTADLTAWLTAQAAR